MPKPSIAAPSDESRERFEKWCPLTIIDASKAPKAAALKSAYWTAWQAAERDTRELCAQLVKLEAVNWDYSDIDPGEAVNLFAENVAERIRGKGAQ